MASNREREVVQAFVSLTSSLVDDFDVLDLLGGLTGDCVRLLDIASTGLLLADHRGVLHVLAASSEETRDLELFQLQRDEGPCLDCFRGGEAVSVADLAAQSQRWPSFVPAAIGAGFASVHAVPMRVHGTMLGTLGLFGGEVGALGDEDLRLAQALAHVASVAIVQGKAVADANAVAEQLQTALSSRVVLEQAKGAVAQRGNLDMEQAFGVLRRYARDRNQRIAEVARAVVARELSAQRLLDHARAKAVIPPQPPPG